MRITFFGGAKREWRRFSLIFLLLDFGFPSTGVTDPPFSEMTAQFASVRSSSMIFINIDLSRLD